MLTRTQNWLPNDNSNDDDDDDEWVSEEKISPRTMNARLEKPKNHIEKQSTEYIVSKQSSFEQLAIERKSIRIK